MKFHQPSCNGTQVIVFTHTHTHRHTDRHIDIRTELQSPVFQTRLRIKPLDFDKSGLIIFARLK